MKQILFAYVLVALFASCQRNRKTKDITLPPREVLVDTTDGKQYKTIIVEGDLPKDVRLSNLELQTIEVMLAKSVKGYNIEQQDKYNKWKEEDPNITIKLTELTIDLRYYKRQYIISKNDDGDKLVRVNCFCSVGDSDYWKTHVIETQDGGKCFFSLVVNLATKEILYFQTNGIA